MTPPSRPPVAPITDRPEFRLGVRLHNEGEFYEAHEAWEQVWRDEEDESHRRFVQGLIQITAGFHKAIVERMPSSARKLMERGLEKIDPFDDLHLGVELGEFRVAVRRWLASHTSGGASDRTTDGASESPEIVPRLAFRTTH
jgi:predicted metal-dependent hydrolase